MKIPFILLSVIALTVACSKSADTSDKEGKDKETKLTVATVPTMDCLPFFIAYEGHYADSLGYQLRLQKHLSLNDCDTAMIHGSVCATPSDYLHAQKLMSDSVVLLDNPNVVLSMLLNSRARIKEAKQLTDKMVACDRKGVSGVVATHVLDSVKLKDEKTFLVNFLDLQVRMKMLQNNEMDAVILPEPQASQMRTAGHQSVYTTSYSEGKLIGRMAFCKKQMDVVRQIYNRACDSINAKGIHAYDSILVKHLHVPNTMLQSVSKRKYQKI